jgi:hypothetical protein
MCLRRVWVALRGLRAVLAVVVSLTTFAVAMVNNSFDWLFAVEGRVQVLQHLCAAAL